MDRREALLRVAWIIGGTVTGANMFLATGCRPSTGKVNALFNQDQIDLLNEVGEIILPASDTPDAKAAKVGELMAVIVRDCYDLRDQKIFINGIDKINVACKQKYGKEFMECDKKQRTEIVISLDDKQEAYMANRNFKDPNHYFHMIKELTLLGFFTSEIGVTEALRYIKIPGKYDGCVPYKKGDRAWAV